MSRAYLVLGLAAPVFPFGSIPTSTQHGCSSVESVTADHAVAYAKSLNCEGVHDIPDYELLIRQAHAAFDAEGRPRSLECELPPNHDFDPMKKILV